jgi:hypothetical protein
MLARLGRVHALLLVIVLVDVGPMNAGEREAAFPGFSLLVTFKVCFTLHGSNELNGRPVSVTLAASV